MIDYIRKIIKPKYDTINVVELSAKNLLDNISFIQSKQQKAEIIAVLKSNAYGHGLKEIATILNKSSVKMVAVDSYPEAQIVYKYFKGKVLILSEMPIDAYRYTKINRTEFVVYRSETLKYLSKYGKKAKVHLFYNSGMNREGFSSVEGFVSSNKEYLDKVTVNGFCSHLASADSKSELNAVQESKFIAAYQKLLTLGYKPKHVHLGNSAGLFILKNDIYTAFRTGLSIYGFSPFKYEINELKPVLEVKSKIMHSQVIEKGENVSYNETYVSDGRRNIALVPFGYFEGLDWRLSGKIKLEVLKDKESYFASIAGRICMNILCLDLNNNSYKDGTVIRVVSANNKHSNSVLNISQYTDGIYQTLVKINPGIRRKIV